MTETDMTTRRSWREALSIYLHARVIGMLFLGFSAGLPFLLVFSTLTAWLRTEGVSLAAIGFFSWIGITYSIKVFWAPVIDRLPLPWLTGRMGRRRSWMLVAIIGIAIGLVGLAMTDPTENLTQVALFALLVAFSSATQDIVVDAYRIEAVEEDLQGGMAATYQLGYRLALLAAGGGALGLADTLSWPLTYMVMASLTVVGLLTVLVVNEPTPRVNPDALKRESRVVAFLTDKHHWPKTARDVGAWFIGAVVCPFVDFLGRYGAMAAAILIFVAVFRITDVLMGAMANPFYIDTGFTLSEIGTIVKVFGTFVTIGGAIVGGIIVARFGIMRPLLVGALLLPLANLTFAVLDKVGPELWMLTLAITADNLSAGFAGTIFIAYLSSLTSSTYTATQYALFSSLMTLPGKILAGFSGLVVESIGYFYFFLGVAAAALPAILLAFFLLRWSTRQPTPPRDTLHLR